MNYIHNPFLTFQEIRTARDMSVTDVSTLVQISNDLLIEYERNSSEMPSGVAIKLCQLYGVSIRHIHIGKSEGNQAS